MSRVIRVEQLPSAGRQGVCCCLEGMQLGIRMKRGVGSARAAEVAVAGNNKMAKFGFD